MTDIKTLMNEIDIWLHNRKDVNVFYIRQRAQSENWSFEKLKEVVIHV